MLPNDQFSKQHSSLLFDSNTLVKKSQPFPANPLIQFHDLIVSVTLKALLLKLSYSRGSTLIRDLRVSFNAVKSLLWAVYIMLIIYNFSFTDIFPGSLLASCSKLSDSVHLRKTVGDQSVAADSFTVPVSDHFLCFNVMSTIRKEQRSLCILNNFQYHISHLATDIPFL